MLFLPLLIALLVPFSALHAQQPSPVTVQVQAGYGDGIYRISNWFPVALELANDGPDLQASVEWRFLGNESGTFRREVDLPRGARKRVTLEVVSGEFARNAELRVFNGETELLKQLVRLQPVDVGQFVAGVLSSDPTLLNSLATMEFDRANGSTVAHLATALLPEDAIALNGIDALFVHDVATADLTPGQREAIRAWLYGGGQLVVSGGASAERAVAGLDALLPVDLGALEGERSLEALQRLARRNDLVGVVPRTTVSAATPRPGAQAIDAEGLLVAADRGAGRAIFAGFDLGATRAWSGEPDLWEQILRAEPRMDIGYTYRQRSDNLLRSTLQLAGLRFPSSFVLVALVLAYIALIGPVNFLVLRRLRRPDLAWVTVPALVLVCLLGTYGASFVLRGTRPQLLQLSIAQGYEGQTEGLATAFVGVFSPQRRDYRLGFESEALISSRAFDGFNASGVTVIGTDMGSEVRDLLIDVSSLRTLIVEQPGIAVPAVTSQLQRSANRVDGQITYGGSLPLEEAMIVYGDASVALGDLAPGQTSEVSLAANLANFPESSIGNEEQIFNRGQVVANLYDFDRFSFNGPNFDGTRGMPERDAVYLLGWVDSALLPIQLDGVAAQQQGMVLYIIRLNS